MLNVSGLCSGYGNVQIIWDASFSVNDGEVVAILGSNGAGKTTLVRTITGMIRPWKGSVVFDGDELAGKSSRAILDHKIVQVPEGRQLFTEMSVYENLEMGAYSKETKAKLAESLEFVYKWFPKLKERRGQAAGICAGLQGVRHRRQAAQAGGQDHGNDYQSDSEITDKGESICLKSKRTPVQKRDLS